MVTPHPMYPALYPLQTSGGLSQKCKAEESSRCTRLRADIIKQINSEAVSAICKLCKRIAINHQFIPEHLRPYFFGARLIPIAKKDGGIRPTAIGTTFHKIISSAIMCNLKRSSMEHSPPVQFGVGMPGGAENIVHDIRDLLSDTQTGHWSPWTLPMHSTLSAELHSSIKCRTSSIFPHLPMGVAVLWTITLTPAHQRCRPNPHSL